MKLYQIIRFQLSELIQNWCYQCCQKPSLNVQFEECVNIQIRLCTNIYVKVANSSWDMNTHRKHLYVSSTSTLNFISSFKSLTNSFINTWCFSTENVKHCSKWEIKATVVFLMDVNTIYEHVYLIFTLSFLLQCCCVRMLKAWQCCHVLIQIHFKQSFQRTKSAHNRENLPCTLSYRCLLGKWTQQWTGWYKGSCE